jgi:hypothetical protein
MKRCNGGRTIASVLPNLLPLFLPDSLPAEGFPSPKKLEPTLADTPKDTPLPLPLPPLSANTGDGDDFKYIGMQVRTSPISDAVASVCQTPSQTPTLLLPLTVLPRLHANRIDLQRITQKAMCKQHLVSAPPGQTGIGTYPFLLHVEEHTPWEFSSRYGSLILHAQKCENRSLNKDG